ncbi:sugar phosphate permease [Arthrobacter sp. B2I5]|uniref:MFS transporter n=1 Tax=Arthrobacter sp. B2I5 TaxID=3042266 RepID=UPI0027842EA8|nr:MFS transporter [Arthrobacter sp. B2I5]MDQ0826127.1 sugar phosphate permease [Arthrobacter sp. B2I5]
MKQTVLDRAQKKAFRRLMPFVALLFVVNQLDRINISVAGPNGMNDELGLTAAQFGLASGLFFIGYMALEVPSNLALHRFGARRWLARIVVTWGIVATALTFVPNAEWLYGLRILLGVAEAGFAPGIVVYLTYWFTREMRSRATAFFLLGIPVAAAFGVPSMTLIGVHMDGFFGLDGWRVILLITGLLAVVLGVMCWFYLTDRPADAHWLTAEESQALTEALATETPEKAGNHSIRKALLNGQVWLLAVAPFLVLYSMFVVTFFLPTLLKDINARESLGLSSVQVGLLSAIPWAIGGAGMLFFASRSDKKREVTKHFVAAATIGSIGFFFLAMFGLDNPYIALAALTVAMVGVLGSLTTFWVLPSRLYTGAAAAGVIALINTIANFGSFLGPYSFGALSDATGGYKGGLIIVAVAMLLAGLLIALRFRDLGRAPDAERVGSVSKTTNDDPEPLAHQAKYPITAEAAPRQVFPREED